MSEPLPAPSITEIGRARARIDGPLKVTGRARYASDHSFPNMLYAVPVGATIAKGKIRCIHASRARQMPGVRAVLKRRRPHSNFAYHAELRRRSHAGRAATTVRR